MYDLPVRVDRLLGEPCLVLPRHPGMSLIQRLPDNIFPLFPTCVQQAVPDDLPHPTHSGWGYQITPQNGRAGLRMSLGDPLPLGSVNGLARRPGAVAFEGDDIRPPRRDRRLREVTASGKTPTGGEHVCRAARDGTDMMMAAGHDRRLGDRDPHLRGPASICSTVRRWRVCQANGPRIV